MITMKWWDPSIKTKTKKDEKQTGEIILSPSSVGKIWIPDLAIEDLTDLKFKDEWISLVKSRFLVPADTMQSKDNNSTPANIEVTYQIKSSVYCTFDHSKYPMDEQKCNVTLGSSSFGAIFVLDNNDEDETDFGHMVSNFRIKSSYFDNGWHTSGNNSIGIKFTMTRSTTPFFFKYYIPTMAITTVSMMGFAIPLTAIPGRVALLVTQFLTLTNLFIYEMVSIII